jgi:alkyl sulfatase BDS1-like metallo-beta-lactamase superfamily hydrolase
MVPWNVRAIWENYAGWFHHKSTTELYAVGPEEITADLVELAGVEKIVGRARSLLVDGEPLKAIHLAEIVNRVEPGNDDAKKVLVGAHEQLLKDSSNFWEAAWLRKQIEELS